MSLEKIVLQCVIAMEMRDREQNAMHTSCGDIEIHTQPNTCIFLGAEILIATN